MIYYVKNTENTKIKIIISETINNKNYAIIKKENKDFIQYIIIHNYKIEGINIEWQYGDYTELIPKNKEKEKIKTLYNQLGYFYLTLSSKI